MEIEPEVISPQGSSRGPRMITPIPKWKLILGGVVAVAFLGLLLWLAFWVALVLIALAIIGAIIRFILNLFSGGSGGGGSSSNVQVVIRRMK
jgi:hypothetical protein